MTAIVTWNIQNGRGCDGVCCREGEPPVYPEEVAEIGPALPRLLPLLRPAARAVVAADGFLGGLHPLGLPKLRVPTRCPKRTREMEIARSPSSERM